MSSEDDLKAYLATNGTKAPIFIKGNTLEEAAKTAGIDAVALRETVKNYNSHVKNGKDLEFNRQPKFMKKTIDEDGSFYIVEQKPRFATTLGGVVVTTKMEVLIRRGTSFRISMLPVKSLTPCTVMIPPPVPTWPGASRPVRLCPT